MIKKGAKIIIDSLINHGVKVVFEFPGGTIAPLLDEIALSKKIDLIVTRNDQAASLMADAYARVAGQCGVCMATCGPGATNLITGIANAYCDSIPMIAITGQVGVGDLKKEKNIRQSGFQEIDIVNTVKPITKWAYQIKDAKEIEEVMDKAFKIASGGRKGPVLIDVPMNIGFEQIEVDSSSSSYFEDERQNLEQQEKEKIPLLIELINKSLRPVIIAGGGVILAKAENELKLFAEKCQIPVATTLTGLGVISSDNPLSLGFMGCYGSRACNKIVFGADLVIGVGNRFDIKNIGTEPGNFIQNKKVVHIDIDWAEIGNRVKTDVAIMGDAELVLKEINKLVFDFVVPANRQNWIDQIGKLKEEFSLEKEYGLDNNAEKKLRPQYIIKKICELTGGKAIIASDVGQNQMWTAQFYKFNESRANLNSAGLGNMGYGLPAALAAKYVCPDKEVINITGDGSFQMNIQELATAKQYNLPVKIFIMHNNTLGLVKQFQDKKFDKRATSTIVEYNPDFDAMAAPYGAIGIRLDSFNKIEEVVKEALKAKNTVIVDCLIDSEELALPELEKGHNLDDQYPYKN